MEIDDMKSAWQSLDRRLEQQHQLQLMTYRDRKLDRTRAHLRPLYWGQLAQILFGALCIFVGATFWSRHLGVLHLMLPGLIVHAYGTIAIIFAARTLFLIRHIDYAAPVVAIQKQISELRTFYVRNGLSVGLTWWLLWIPFLLVLFGFLGVDLWLRAPEVVYINVVVGMAGLLGTWWFHRWSRGSGRPRLRKLVDETLSGSSLTHAQRFLDEIAQFEKE